MRKSDSDKVKDGDKWSRNSYGVVVDKTDYDVRVRNEEGMEWSISRSIFENEFNTANQHTEVKEVTRTQLTNIIMEHARVVMTVVFRKQSKPKDLTDLVELMLKDPTPYKTRRKIQATLKSVTDGEKRTLVGRHYGNVNEQGRITFHDMEASGHPLRLVDPRTIASCIVNQTLYKVK